MKPSKLLRSRQLRGVIVTTKAGAAFSGLLHSVATDAWVLREAEALGAGEQGAPAARGRELVVLTADIAYVQLP